MGVFPVLVCLSNVYIPYVGYNVDMDCQEDNFSLFHINLINRNSPRVSFITQTDIGR